MGCSRTGSADQSGDRSALPFRFRGLVLTQHSPTSFGMRSPPDPRIRSARPKISLSERRLRTADRVKTIRLKMAIGRDLDDRGITPATLANALKMPLADLRALLTRKQWREGDVALLEAAATHLGLRVLGPASDSWPS